MRRSRRVRAVLAAVLFVAVALPIAPAVAQQLDHLTCYVVKDDNKVKGKEPVTISNLIELGTDCTVNKKATELCRPTVKDGGDDPRGPQLDVAYICYEVTCDKTPVNNSQLVTQFGAHSLAATRAKRICAPAEPGF